MPRASHSSCAVVLTAVSILIGGCTAHPQPQQQSAQSQAQGPAQPQAASPSSSSVSASASTSSASGGSSSSGERQYVNIPTSTIVSIGVGFVAFSSAVLFALLLLRVFRLRKIAAARGTTFSVVWRNEGGFWGFWTSFGGSDAELVGIGAGGHAGWGMRVIRDRLREAELEKMKPVMWESEWYDDDNNGSGGKGNTSNADSSPIGALALDIANLKPLAVLTSTVPPTPPPPPPILALPSEPKPKPIRPISASSLPTLDLCVLIQLPSPTLYDPALEELPELVIGRTTLLPLISPTTQKNLDPAPQNTRSYAQMENGHSREEVEVEIGSRLEYETKKDEKGEIQQIEYAGDPHVLEGTARRRAEWKLVRGQWTIEGLRGGGKDG
ncbi:hypothetical protein I316_01569 [Kwoniella heveanensis BCC8398]|uniref:Uncharacterized protein n=1 Tax=Kwoniella heveanensis BCC8398 TaxID=1296120 RepID=A0A1B9H118_9TREE|nr:hypothetical protein I316_01569 [Kwoniella heveanensis BCC8398]